MIRLFKHYIPHAVMLLGLFDTALLACAADLAWRLRASQIGIAAGPLLDRLDWLSGYAGIMLAAMPTAKRIERGFSWRSRTPHSVHYTRCPVVLAAAENLTRTPGRLRWRTCSPPTRPDRRPTFWGC